MASASAAARLCVLACRSTSRVTHIPRTQQPLARQCIVAQRAFSTTRIRWAEEEGEEKKKRRRGEDEEDDAPVVLQKMEAAFLEAATPEDLAALDALAKENGFNSLDEMVQAGSENNFRLAANERAMYDQLVKEDKGDRPNRTSFWYDEEDPETFTEEHDEFDEDDITSMAHGKLDEVRDMRQYARLTVWEMPLLSKLAKPFTPPTDKQVLRWRYTSYMGEFHPAEKKVVVQFAPDDLGLTPQQASKLKKLAGTRYNPETEIIKMSSESFEHQAQNKAYLSNLVDDLIAAAKDPADTFEDIPLDTRHHKTAKKPKFPKHWKLTPERRKELSELRVKALLNDTQRAEAGLLVDGGKVIDGYLTQKLLQEQQKEKEAEMVAAAAAMPKLSGGARARR